MRAAPQKDRPVRVDVDEKTGGEKHERAHQQSHVALTIVPAALIQALLKKDAACRPASWRLVRSSLDLDTSFSILRWR